MAPISDGRRSAKSGSRNEGMFQKLLESYGFVELLPIQKRQIERWGPDISTLPLRQFGHRWFICQARMFPSIFEDLEAGHEHKWKVDFFVYDSLRYKSGYVIECKYQDSPGSVDEKLPYTVQNLLTRKPACLFMSGDGFTPRSKHWALKQNARVGLDVVQSFEAMMRFMNEKFGHKQ